MKNEGFWSSDLPQEEINKIEKKIWKNGGIDTPKDIPPFDSVYISPLKQNEIQKLISKYEEKTEIELEKEEWFNEYQKNNEEILRLYKEASFLIDNNDKLQIKIDKLLMKEDYTLKNNEINTLYGYISKNLDRATEKMQKAEELESINDKLKSKNHGDINRMINEN